VDLQRGIGSGQVLSCCGVFGGFSYIFNVYEWGSRGQGFKSLRPDYFYSLVQRGLRGV